MTDTTAPANVLLPCPCCGEASAALTVNLGHLDDAECFQCLECSAEFGLADVEDLIAKWTKILAWVKAVPQFDAE